MLARLPPPVQGGGSHARGSLHRVGADLAEVPGEPLGRGLTAELLGPCPLQGPQIAGDILPTLLGHHDGTDRLVADPAERAAGLDEDQWAGRIAQVGDAGDGIRIGGALRATRSCRAA